MGLRALLVGLIVAATAAFVVGIAIERSSSAETPAAGESTAEHAREATTTESQPATEKPHAELRPLGIDVEAWPFAALAAVTSLALAAAAWLRPRRAPVLGLVAAAMLVFAVLDLREVVHQSDSGDTGLAILAAVVAALHLGAAGIAGVMASRAWRPGAATPGAPGTMAV